MTKIFHDDSLSQKLGNFSYVSDSIQGFHSTVNFLIIVVQQSSMIYTPKMSSSYDFIEMYNQTARPNYYVLNCLDQLWI